jgi:phosphoglycerol transferase MdoB-like AlkP superfamily enzyme
MNNFKTLINSRIGGLICNLLLAYVMLMAARIIFFFVNYATFAPYMSWPLFWDMLHGSIVFDTTAMIYMNAIYIVMVLLPLHIKENDKYYAITKIVYVVLNSLALMANLVDSVYFQYTGRRTTMTVFSEFSNENNIAGIIGIEMLRHWYLVLIFIALIWAMWKLYRKPKEVFRYNNNAYYVTQLLLLIAAIPLCIGGIRGGFSHAVRPITISNANQYVNRPVEAALVLNTPFSIIRTIGKTPFTNPNYMSDAEMEKTYSPVHQPAAGTIFQKKNVVIIIVESLAKEYIGGLNGDLEGGRYAGYTPFIDTLINHSVTFKYCFANGHKSIDAMPSALSGIPMFVEPFFLTSASLDNVSGIAGALDKKGYYTAFFHGAPNGSMGFEAFARATGYKQYFGLNEYDKEPGTGGEKDFDGMWAIWDEPFLQYFCKKMSTFKQPFMTTVFTASSHHPFKIPEQYKGTFKEGPVPILKCVRYTDMSLKRFFESASRQPWFKNTLFVITGDHTNQTYHKEYDNDCGTYAVPVIFYAPGDSLMHGHNMISTAQQCDIMPTVLGYLGYDKPYISFGCNLLGTHASKTFAVNYNNGMYQFFKGEWMMQFDGVKTRAMYRYRSDRMLRNNLVGKVPQQAAMEHELKAIIQQYMERMNQNRLVVKK